MEGIVEFLIVILYVQISRRTLDPFMPFLGLLNFSFMKGGHMDIAEKDHCVEKNITMFTYRR